MFHFCIKANANTCLCVHYISFQIETHPQILESPKVYPDLEDNQLVFKCEFKSNTIEDAARFHVSWFEEFPLQQLDKTELINGTDRVARLFMRSTSSNGSPIFRLGKKVSFSCIVVHQKN